MSYLYGMKWYLHIVFMLPLVLPVSLAAYSDHRGHNVDSLEAAVARWTPEAIASASDSALGRLILDWNGLMQGYLQTNGVKSEYYARKVLKLARTKGWMNAVKDASKIIGQQFWARENYDSAAYFYRIALDALDSMSAGATSPTNPEGYTQLELDDGYSSMYGTLGNLYNMMGELDTAFAYYAKAGEIFDRYGWNESNAVLHYNMGETWLEEREYDKAKECYEAALRYGRQAGDSLWIASPLKGLGALYLAQGRTRKGLRCLEEADNYFSIHEDQEFRARLETLDVMGQILREQRKQLRLMVGLLGAALLLLIVTAITRRRLRKVEKARKEAGEVLDEALKEMQLPEGVPELSAREKEIIQLISSGHTGPQIADRICLSPETVKWYRKKLLVKLDVSNTAELISKAKDLGIV